MSFRDVADHPRPQLVRDAWQSLDGPWGFAWDDAGVGSAERWFESGAADRFAAQITVPFAPESAASGIGETSHHRRAWYRRSFEVDQTLAVPGNRTLLHFGAVDHRCRVWVDGSFVGSHVGGQTPFSFDVTEALSARTSHSVVVEAEDDPEDLEVPRGKQDWLEDPHVIWYHRTTGIWRTVWLESVPAVHIAALDWSSELSAGSVTCDIRLSRRPEVPVRVRIEATLEGAPFAMAEVELAGVTGRVVLHPDAVRGGQVREMYQWSPERPTLIDATVSLTDGNSEGDADRVASYFGIRTVAAEAGSFLLNGVPYFVRAVLEQGYWPESDYTPPTLDALREEVELIRALGFNTARVHQKTEDPRFLYWADRLGLMVWGETAAAYEFSPRAVELLAREWLDIVARDRSHPSVVVWVPFNESWGVQDIALSAAQRQYVQALASLTRALDPTRPVISNDGWEHVDSDLFTVHDYTADAAVIAARYSDASARQLREHAEGMGPQGRRLALGAAQGAAFATDDRPLLISEFGGVSFSGDGSTWGYALADDDESYAARLSGLFEALNRAPSVVGFCYTQLTDTLQEANGLLRADRTPKLPVPDIRAMVIDEAEARERFVWPPTVTEGDG